MSRSVLAVFLWREVSKNDAKDISTPTCQLLGSGTVFHALRYSIPRPELFKGMSRQPFDWHQWS